MKKENLAHWIVSTLSLGIAVGSLALWLRAPRGPQRELTLYDEAGRARIRLVASSKEPGLELLDEGGHVRASLSQGLRGTSLQFFRPGSTQKAIDLIVPNELTGPTSDATMTAYSPDGKHQSVVAAGDTAWISVRSGAGHIHISHAEEQSEIGFAYVGSYVKLEVSKNESSFTTTKPLSIGIAGPARPYSPGE